MRPDKAMVDLNKSQSLALAFDKTQAVMEPASARHQFDPI
jgi:hypothetical protein